MGGGIGGSDLVMNQRVRLKRHEAMGKAWRNPELAAVFGRKLGPRPLPESRRTLPDIHPDIEDRACQAGDKLALGKRRQLEMQPAKRAGGGRKRLVVLHEPDIGDMFAEPGFLEEFGKITAGIADAARGDEDQVGDGEGGVLQVELDSGCKNICSILLLSNQHSYISKSNFFWLEHFNTSAVDKSSQLIAKDIRLIDWQSRNIKK